MDKITLLSQAIRLGSTFHPQAFSQLVNKSNGQMRTCALGAALEAIGKLDERDPDQQLRNRFGNDVTELVECPLCEGYRYNLLGLVAHLNDEHRWTRERIADWLETYEL